MAAAEGGKKGGGKGRSRKAAGGAEVAPVSVPGERPTSVGGLFATDAPSNAWVEIDYSRQLLDSGYNSPTPLTDLLTHSSHTRRHLSLTRQLLVFSSSRLVLFRGLAV